MNAITETKSGLELLRQPFPAHTISKLPKPTKRQTDEVKADFKKGIRCKECGGWHHKDVVHLDYVGHAALTDRLLDCDPYWNWEPVAFAADGSPAVDQNGGMWIKLTVCGVTRMGYGDADGKTGGNAVKERIGDALRNAAMRFGAALDLWHKGDLHQDDEQPDNTTNEVPLINAEQFTKLRDKVEEAGADTEKLCKHYGASSLQQFPASKFDQAMTALAKKIEDAKPLLSADEIPY